MIGNQFWGVTILGVHKSGGVPVGLWLFVYPSKSKSYVRQLGPQHPGDIENMSAKKEKSTIGNFHSFI